MTGFVVIFFSFGFFPWQCTHGLSSYGIYAELLKITLSSLSERVSTGRVPGNSDDWNYWRERMTGFVVKFFLWVLLMAQREIVHR